MSAAAPAPIGWHDCRDTFSKTVEALAEADPRIVTVVSNSVGSSKLVNFRKRWPERMVNVGIAEQTVVARTLATYPMAQSDVALVVDRSVPAAAVRDALVGGGGELLEEVRLFDVYEGDQVGEGRRSLAYRLTFRSAERTLTTDEVSALRDAAVAAAAAAHGAVQRA